MGKQELEKVVRKIVHYWDTDTTIRYWNQYCDEMGYEDSRIVPVGDSLDEYCKEAYPDVTGYDVYDLGCDDGEIIDWLVNEIYYGYKKLEDLDRF